MRDRGVFQRVDRGEGNHMQTPCRRHPARVCDQREHQRDGSGVSTGSQEVGGIEMSVVVAVDSIDVESNNTI
jgi:hypothetical protein